MKNEKKVHKENAEINLQPSRLFESEKIQTVGIIPNFRNHYTPTTIHQDGERNVKPSIAIPDMSLSVQEIIKRHTRGLPIFGTEMGYDQTFDPLGGRDINSMDLEEVWQIANEARQRYSAAQNKYIAEQKLKQEAELRHTAIEDYKKIQAAAASQEPKVLEKVPTKDQ